MICNIFDYMTTSVHTMYREEKFVDAYHYNQKCGVRTLTFKYLAGPLFFIINL